MLLFTCQIREARRLRLIVKKEGLDLFHTLVHQYAPLVSSGEKYNIFWIHIAVLTSEQDGWYHTADIDIIALVLMLVARRANIVTRPYCVSCLQYVTVCI